MKNNAPGIVIRLLRVKSTRGPVVLKINTKYKMKPVKNVGKSRQIAAEKAIQALKAAEVAVEELKNVDEKNPEDSQANTEHIPTESFVNTESSASDKKRPNAEIIPDGDLNPGSLDSQVEDIEENNANEGENSPMKLTEVLVGLLWEPISESEVENEIKKCRSYVRVGNADDGLDLVVINSRSGSAVFKGEFNSGNLKKIAE